ncbi:hypothetical protein [Aquimarina agarilytica]|uniref:hypothetical protein n=1 Tax=Aquimarina agarilytica TaxID=1087449 RepID=UPI0002894FB1|nr:hypothetical protein [Aquimarina agarilytica]
MNTLQNCLLKLDLVAEINQKMIVHYDTLINNNDLEEIIPSLEFLKSQKKRFYNASVYEIDRLKKQYPSVDVSIKDDFKLDFTIPIINSENIDSYLLQLIATEQDFIGFYLKITCKLNPVGAVFHRFVNHINEMRESLTMLERNVTHQQQLLIA